MASTSGTLAAGAVALVAVGALVWAFRDHSGTAPTGALNETAPPAPAATRQVAPAPAAAPSAQLPIATPQRTDTPPPTETVDFLTRRASADAGDIDAAFDVGMAALLCIQFGRTFREQNGLTVIAPPAIDLSQFDCEEIPDDQALVERWLRQAADEGHVAAAREYGVAAIYFVERAGGERASDLSQSDQVALAAKEYRALDYLEFAATSGDLTAAAHLAYRYANGLTLPAGQLSGGIQLRGSEPAKALAWFYAVQIAGDEPLLQRWSDELRAELAPQAVMDAQAQGQEFYYSYLAPDLP